MHERKTNIIVKFVVKSFNLFRWYIYTESFSLLVFTFVALQSVCFSKSVVNNFLSYKQIIKHLLKFIWFSCIYIFLVSVIELAYCKIIYDENQQSDEALTLSKDCIFIYQHFVVFQSFKDRLIPEA